MHEGVTLRHPLLVQVCALRFSDLPETESLIGMSEPAFRAAFASVTSALQFLQ